MPRTKGDKYIGGIDYISKLSHHHGCKSFSGGITTCSCILNFQDKLPEFFKEEVKEFWKAPSCLAVCMDGPAIRKLFWEYLYPFCSLHLKELDTFSPFLDKICFLPSHCYLHVWTWTACSCCHKKSAD